MESKLFLDTTVQIDRATKDYPTNSRIKQVISKYNAILSSSYVKMEYKRRYIRDLIYLNSLAQDSDSLGDIFSRLTQLPSEQQRKLRIVIASIAHFFYEFQQVIIQGAISNEILEMLRIYLPEAIELAWEQFEDVLTDLLNETNCYLAKEKPQKKGKKFDSKVCHCTRGRIRCDIVQFLENHRASFEKILDAYRKAPSLDDEQAKAKKMLEIVLKIPQEMANYKKCWNLGDVIIGIESPTDAILFNNNPRHFQVICHALGKSHCTY